MPITSDKAPSTLQILALSTVFPNPLEPSHGIFVRNRLEHIAALADVEVIAPVPLLDYSNPSGKLFGSFSIPLHRLDSGLKVTHPRWLFPPLGTPLNVLCLFLRLIYPVLQRRGGFQIIDSHFGYPEGVAAALLARCAGVPFFVTLRGNEPIFSRSPIRRFFIRQALLKAARVITVSEELREFAISMGVAPGKVVTIPNGVDAGVFFPRDPLEMRRKHNLPETEPIILSAGSLGREKGHDRIVQALNSAGLRKQNSLLVFAGGAGRDASFSGELRGLVASLNQESRVRFTGQVSQQELAELMCASDVLCLASSAEGWPNVVHEALACGTPVVATAVGSVPEMIPSTDFGYTVPVNDQALLEEALASALLKKWDRAIISGWGQARSWSQVAEEVVNQMRIVLQGRAAL